MPVRTPIRFRLRTALFIAGAFSLFLTAYFAVSYITIKRSLTQQSDGEVYEQLDSILSHLHSFADERDFPKLASTHNATGEATIGLKLVRFDNPSKTLLTLGPTRLTTLLDSHTFFLKELPLDIHSGNNTLRILARSNKIFTIFAAINTIAFQEVFDDMLRTYLILLFTGILFSFLIGMLTAGFALKPLKILVSSARAIKDESIGTQHELPTDTKTLEINELALVMNDILSARDRNIAALRDFTADAAHELRTPLTILKGELEVDLRTKELTSDEKEAVKSNLEEVQRLIRIVEDLLTLARAEQTSYDRADIGRESWRISELISQLVNRLKPIADEKNIQISSKTGAEASLTLPYIQVERIVENILLNAIQYTPEGKSVSIFTETDSSGNTILMIKDEGIGLSSEELKHIFDRFWRADISRNRLQGGTGLGLTIAKKLADRLKIDLECTSNPGEGTTMKCIFPPSISIPS